MRSCTFNLQRICQSVGQLVLSSHIYMEYEQHLTFLYKLVMEYLIWLTQGPSVDWESQTEGNICEGVVCHTEWIVSLLPKFDCSVIFKTFRELEKCSRITYTKQCSPISFNFFIWFYLSHKFSTWRSENRGCHGCSICINSKIVGIKCIYIKTS